MGRFRGHLLATGREAHMLQQTWLLRRTFPALPAGMGDLELLRGPGSPVGPQTCTSLSTGFWRLTQWTCP